MQGRTLSIRKSNWVSEIVRNILLISKMAMSRQWPCWLKRKMQKYWKNIGNKEINSFSFSRKVSKVLQNIPKSLDIKSQHVKINSQHGIGCIVKSKAIILFFSIILYLQLSLSLKPTQLSQTSNILFEDFISSYPNSQ